MATAKPVIREYYANIGCMRLGSSDETWRNRSDGTYYAVGSFEFGSTLQETVDNVAARRKQEFYQQYQRFEVRVTSNCAGCGGRGRLYAGERGLKSKLCPNCKGKPTEQTELTYTV